MLSTVQKATILAKAGFDVPPRPDAHAAPAGAGTDARTGAADAMPAAMAAAAASGSATSAAAATTDGDTPMQTWVRAVEILYATYAAARAAKSLRDAEEARQAEMLRRMSASRAYA